MCLSVGCACLWDVFVYGMIGQVPSLHCIVSSCPNGKSIQPSLAIVTSLVLRSVDAGGNCNMHAFATDGTTLATSLPP